jgi:glycine/D-amino acid oxidase-like deaminating enzyme
MEDIGRRAATKTRVAVIGAGAFGGWTALHLAREGAQVTLVDAWGAGNSRSSSGGESRVIRAIYGADRIYVEMVRRAAELWSKIDTPSDRIYVETGVLWIHRGDDAYVRSSAPLLQEFGFPLDRVPIDEARKRYPQVSFDGVTSVWLERRAGVLSARHACMVVRDSFVRAGGTYRIGRVEPGAIVNGSMGHIRLDDGSRLEADAFVFACGPWLGKLFPDVIGEWVRPTRQEGWYFGTPAGSHRYLPGQMPTWLDMGERIFYGMPDVHGRGFKVADDTRGAPIDPTVAERTASPEGIERARQLLRERFPELANAPLLSAEVCQYENSPDGHLILDRHPGAKNVWIAGGGSGHGFKLSPAVGEYVAQSVLHDRELPKMFRLERLHAIEKQKTQFEG